LRFISKCDLQSSTVVQWEYTRWYENKVRTVYIGQQTTQTYFDTVVCIRQEFCIALRPPFVADKSNHP